jgi:CRISPR/Cas system-associated endonuclease Cas1
VLALINQGIIQPSDFSPDGGGGIQMNARARKALLKAHGEKLAASSTSEKEGESVPYGKRILSREEKWPWPSGKERTTFPLS